MRPRDWAKYALQCAALPAIYRLFCFRKPDPALVILADGHSDEIPFSMSRLYDELLKRPDLRVELFIQDFAKLSFPRLVWTLIKFMRAYAAARTVVICDYFLPVASCAKRRGTKVIQLWHGGGFLKKIAYDAPENIPAGYRGNVFRNWDVFTVSSGACVSVLSSATRLPRENFAATGMSRADYFFDEAYIEECRKAFYARYPEAEGKLVVLWAPTFRGSAGEPELTGAAEVLEMKRRLPEKYFVLIQVHPHLKQQYGGLDCGMTGEALLPVTDILITDYSSILFDYAAFKKPFVLFAPDLEEYRAKRGFYIDYGRLPGELVTDGAVLAGAVTRAYERFDPGLMRGMWETHMGACDGQATERIVGLI